MYNDLISTSRIQNVLQEINENGKVADPCKFKKISFDLMCFEEVDNEFNRTTFQWYIRGTTYASALLFYCAVKGWKEPVTLLLELNIELLDICLHDSDCDPLTISKEVLHLFPEDMFTLWDFIKLKH